MTPRHRVVRVGRLGARHRRWTYAVLAACGLTGFVWFVLLDLFDWPPPRVTTWWILHGLLGWATLGVLGAVLPQHVPVAWSHARNRGLGGTTLGLLVVVVLSAAAMSYGREAWHDVAHWLHIGAGIVLAAVFAAHAVFGKRSVGRLPAEVAVRRRHN